MDIFTTMNWFKRARNELPGYVIKNCWLCSDLMLEVSEAHKDAQEQTKVSEWASCVSVLVPLRRGLSVRDRLNIPEEDDVIKKVSDDAIVATGTIDYAPEKEEEMDCGNDGEVFPSMNDQPHALSLIKKIVVQLEIDKLGS